VASKVHRICPELLVNKWFQFNERALSADDRLTYQHSVSHPGRQGDINLWFIFANPPEEGILKSVCIAVTCSTTEEFGFVSRQQQNTFLFFRAFRPALGPTHPPA
jgi:hypothetical protein